MSQAQPKNYLPITRPFMPLPEQSPVFIFPFSKTLSDAEKENATSSTNQFLSQWQSHGDPLRAEAWVEESRFLLVVVDADLTVPSGCSKDKLYHFIQNLELEMGISRESPTKFFVKSGEEILTFSRNELKLAWSQNQITSESQLFPVWIETYGQYQSIWKSNLGQFASVLKLPVQAAPIESNF